MKVIIDTKCLLGNIAKAQDLANKPIALMFKDFYEDIYSHIQTDIKGLRYYALNLAGSVCYSIEKAKAANAGTIVVSGSAAETCAKMGIKDFFIPINADDDREGLSLYETKKLGEEIRSWGTVHGLITSGCMNDRKPSMKRLLEIWRKEKDVLADITLGGSFWLGQDVCLPDFVSEVRIGEYMLFGTIPYNEQKEKLGHNGILLETRVVSVYPERSHILLDCGYSMADMEKCHCENTSLQYVDSSSEYTIMDAGKSASDYCVGDKVFFTPNYKSLVKLRYAEREYR